MWGLTEPAREAAWCKPACACVPQQPALPASSQTRRPAPPAQLGFERAGSTRRVTLHLYSRTTFVGQAISFERTE